MRAKATGHAGLRGQAGAAGLEAGDDGGGEGVGGALDKVIADFRIGESPRAQRVEKKGGEAVGRGGGGKEKQIMLRGQGQ